MVEDLRAQWRKERAENLDSGKDAARASGGGGEDQENDAEWQALDGEDPADGDLAPLAIRVELDRSPESNPDGSHRQTMWSALAHNFSGPGRRRADRLVEEFERELEALAEEEAAAKDAAFEEELRSVETLLVMENGDQDARAAAMEGDWKFIRADRLAEEDPADATALREAVFECFAPLNELFDHYCGTSYIGPLAAMAVVELEHMLLVSQAVDAVRDQKAIDRIVRQAKADRSELEKMFEPDQLSRFEFVEALILLARHKYARERKRDAPVPSAAESFRRLCEEKLIPMARRLSTGFVRELLRARSMHRFLWANIRKMHVLFLFYAQLSGRQQQQQQQQQQYTGQSVLMDEEQFMTLLEHCGILAIGGTVPAPGAAIGKETINRPVVREIFAATHRDEDDSVGIITSSQSTEQLVFHEFIEALARIILVRWQDQSVPASQRLRWGFNAVLSLADHPGEATEEPLELPTAQALAEMEREQRAHRPDAASRRRPGLT